jgi:hypothetical protein
MYGILLLLLLTLPLLFQIVFGRKAIYENVKLTLSEVCLISFCSQIIFYYFAFKLLDYKLRSESNGQFHCGMPFVGLVVVEFFFIIVLIIIMAVQYFIRKSYNRNTENNNNTDK